MNFFQKDIETMPRKELEALQLERLKNIVAYCYNNTKFYHDKLDAATDTQEVMWTGIDIPRVSKAGNMSGNPFCHVEAGPDGRLYFYTYHRTQFMAYDTKTNTLEMLGQIPPRSMQEANPDKFVASMAMAFDKDGMLWYVAGYNGYHLCRINVMDPNAEAEDFGLVGISDRAMFCAEKSYIIDDVFYIADTNHSVDTSAGIYAIDLAKVREITDETPREICQDIQLYVDSDGNLINREFYKGDLEKDSEKRRSEIAEGVCVCVLKTERESKHSKGQKNIKNRQAKRRHMYYLIKVILK